MQFIEFEHVKVNYLKETYDTIVIAEDEFLIISHNNYVNLSIKKLHIKSINKNSIEIIYKEGLFSKNMLLSIEDYP